jgi:hypothetical protein
MVTIMEAAYHDNAIPLAYSTTEVALEEHE